MQQKIFNALLIAAMVISMIAIVPASAAPPAPGDEPVIAPEQGVEGTAVNPLELKRQNNAKAIDQPNIKDYLRNMERRRLLEAGQYAEAAALAQAGTDNVLVLLVEFAGTDVVTWEEGDTWDPLGIADPNEFTGVVGDCSNIITQTQTFTYTGPLHNEIPRPVSPDDRSFDTIWTEDFSPDWFDGFMFQDGVVISYTMEDGTPIHVDFTGQSVADYYDDLSDGQYNIVGDIVGWLQVDHSTWWYDADQCPGARSGVSTSRGVLPGGGNARTLVKDALDKVNEKIEAGELPDFDWADYDLDDDKIIDRLWIVHAGYGEEDSTVLLNRTDYSEAAVWSHSSSVTPPYVVDEESGIAAGAYIVMPENGGIGVFAHEYGHNLGAMDLYSYGDGETSAGFWTLMADDWTGYPIGFEPPAVDPYHMENWGWLDGKLITDTTQVYEFTLGQASRFPGGEDMYRGAKIELPDAVLPLAVPVWDGEYYWWGGKQDLANAMMTTAAAVSVPSEAVTATLEFDLVYDIEDEWDFLWIQVSADDGLTWDTLTNANTQCDHDPGWVGGEYGFPDDLCAAGIGGFYGYNHDFPLPEGQVFDLTPYAGEDILVRFWYMTDWATTYFGAFVDNVAVMADGEALFSDDAETDDGQWVYEAPWIRSNGTLTATHNFFLQWRNTGENGGYDSALGDLRWRFGPAETGLLMWYNNNFYTDNEIYAYMTDFPSIGPKGTMMVIDAQPDPYRDPNSEFLFEDGLENERANVTNRAMIHDAPFNLQRYTNDIEIEPPYVISPTLFEGREGKKTFHDALGYYPGVEYSKLADTSTTRYYITRDWDASTVIPAKEDYSVKGPADYPSDASLPNLIWRYNAGIGEGWYLLTPGAADVGSGNPGDEMLQYGWHVEVLEQAPDNTWAKVRVWNSLYALDTKVTADTDTAEMGDTVEYDIQLKNTGSKSSFMVCLPFAEQVDYVPGSASAGALFLEACPSGETAWGEAASVAEPNAIAWVINDLPTEAETYFSFSVEVKSIDAPELDVEVNAYTPVGEIYTSLTADSVALPYHPILLPLLMR